jgi:hypothetical protein
MPRWLRGIPILGVFLRYLNLYVGRGETKYLAKMAPLDLWLDRFVVPVAIIAGLTAVGGLYLHMTGNLDRLDSHGLVSSVFPSLLGFGIGVFALIFVLPDDLMGALDKRRAKSGLGSSMMISDMAYPLVYLALGIVVSAVLELLISSPVKDFLQLFVFLYGLTLVSDLIGVIAAAALAARFKKTKRHVSSDRQKLLSRIRRK